MTTYIRNVIIASPLYFLSIVPFVVLANYINIEINIGYALLGALGWWVALLLRVPIILYAKYKKLDNKRSSTLIIGAS